MHETEVEMALAMGGRRLNDDVIGLLFALREVGDCVAITRNQCASVEACGRFEGQTIGMDTCDVNGEFITLRAFVPRWSIVIALDSTGDEPRRIRVFDKFGLPIHEVRSNDSDGRMWDAIVLNRLATTPLEITPTAPSSTELPDHDVDRQGLMAVWNTGIDTFEWSHVLANCSARPVQALRVAPEARARHVPNDAIEHVLKHAEEIAIDIANPGCEQTFVAGAKRVLIEGPSLHVVEENVTVHLSRDRVESTWVVRKRSASGILSWLELYAHGELIARIRNRRAGSELVDSSDWRHLLDRIGSVRR